MIFTGSHILAKFKKRPRRASIFTHRLIPLKFKEYIEILPYFLWLISIRCAASGPNIF